MAFAAGQRIGDYEIVAKLGAGGLGVVYEAQHVISQRREALKFLLPEQLGTADMVERFRREIQTLAALNHVNIAALHNAFYHDDHLVMVMELIHGETLRNYRLKNSIPVPRVLDLTIQILNALDYAHRLGVVHRDIKPANVMITGNGAVKLLDFGIAITQQASELTLTGYLVGSLHFMSPEQVSGKRATPQSDIYSVGVTLYELLTGVLPIKGDGNFEIMAGHITQIPTPPHHVTPQVPLAISNAVMRALEKDPGRRFSSAEEFVHALQSVPLSKQETTLALPQTKPDTHSSGPSGGSFKPATPSASGMQSLPLEDVSRKLAVYIGPVAKIVIKKLAAQSDNLDFIYQEAAKQISSEADRAAFLRSRNRH
jgi:serine/threonine-protein kinase